MNQIIELNLDKIVHFAYCTVRREIFFKQSEKLKVVVTRLSTTL